MSIRTAIKAIALMSALMAGAGVKAAAAAEPYFVDLSQAVNVGMEDDGMAGNGQGGWSDEGANDMFIFPAVPLGKSAQNGYAFNIIDPAKNGGKNVIMLQGKKLADHPAE